MSNLWILTEERPKQDVINSIIKIYCKKFSIDFKDTHLNIVPNFNNHKFIHTYNVNGYIIEGINKIYIKIISGTSSFVDFLLFKQENEPSENEQLLNCILAIEETKTNSTESRNTAAGQRAIKFFFLNYYRNLYKVSFDSIMLYNNPESQNDDDPESVVFIKKCLKTIDVEFHGDKSIDLKGFTSIEELISFKNNMKQPPASNTPVRITKKDDQIFISGTLSKPKEVGNIAHDPNVGQLICIAGTLRRLNWQGKIIITNHKVKQSKINNMRGNKFLFAMNSLNIQLKDIDTPQLSFHNDYWYYEKNGEKIATIFLHVLCDYLEFHSIYANHAGAERGYFYTLNKSEIVIDKKIHLPDYVFADLKNKKIYICEGEMYNNYELGILQLEGFEGFINNYITKNYKNFSVESFIVLSNSNDDDLKKKVIFQIGSNGNIKFSSKLPLKIQSFLNDC